MRAFKRGAALRADERPVLLVREFVPVEQAVPLERLAAFLADELPLLAVNVEYVILQDADAGERLAAMLAHDVTLLHVELPVPVQIRLPAAPKRAPVHVAREALLAPVDPPHVLVQGSPREQALRAYLAREYGLRRGCVPVDPAEMHRRPEMPIVVVPLRECVSTISTKIWTCKIADLLNDQVPTCAPLLV